MATFAHLLKPPRVVVPAGRVIQREKPDEESKRKAGPRPGMSLTEEIEKLLKEAPGKRFPLAEVASSLGVGSRSWLWVVLGRLVKGGRVQVERRRELLYFIEGVDMSKHGGHRNFGGMKQPTKAQSAPQQITNRIGINKTHIVMEWERPIINLMFTPDELDALCGQLQAAKQAFLAQ